LIFLLAPVKLFLVCRKELYREIKDTKRKRTAFSPALKLQVGGLFWPIEDEKGEKSLPDVAQLLAAEETG